MKKSFTLKEKPKDDQSISKNTDTGGNDHILLHNNKQTGLRKDLYMDAIHAIFERYRKRVESYYCPNIKCRATFWNAQKGYVCSECGSFGIISEYKSHTSMVDDQDHTIIGYLDDIGRLICRTCVERYGMNNDINYIVYNYMQPYCRESCEICRKALSRR
ncbi:MAG: hypothetical protein JXM72_07740 [Deltaproteobacteria bacterium]|nr:hypothetical protein [Deltaproteobacteria bacterium]